MRVRLVAVLLLAGLGACTCQGRRPVGRDAGVAPAATTPTHGPSENRLTPAARVGTVYGRVLLEPGTILPRWSLDEIGRGADASPIPPECGPPRDVDTLPVTGVGSPTRLVGVMVSATGPRDPFFAALGAWEPADRVATIEHCRVAPKMISATIGDTLVIENDTDVAFLPTAGPALFHETLIRGQSRRVPLDRGGVSSVQCGFAAACGRGELIVIFHPVHTVTDADGRFELRNVPADMDIELHAFHLYFEEAGRTVRVSRNGRVELDITIRPKVIARTQTDAERAAAARDAGAARPVPPGN